MAIYLYFYFLGFLSGVGLILREGFFVFGKSKGLILGLRFLKGSAKI